MTPTEDIAPSIKVADRWRRPTVKPSHVGFMWYHSSLSLSPSLHSNNFSKPPAVRELQTANHRLGWWQSCELTQKRLSHIHSVHQHTSPRYKPGLLPATVLIVVTNCNTSLEFRSEKNPVSEQARCPGDGVTRCHVPYAVPFHTYSSTRPVCTLGVCNTHGFIFNLSDDTASNVDDYVTSQRMT
jgi:hypothetical protein